MWTQAVERSGRIVGRLLSRDRVFGAVQRGFSASLTARKAFERNVVRILSTANVPSLQDLDRLHEQVRAIDQDLDDAVLRVQRLSKRLTADPSALRRQP